jgi:hypothetical protein
MKSSAIMLKNFEIDPSDARRIKWKFSVRYEGTSMLVVAWSLRRHPVLVDLQQLAAVADIDWPPEVVDAITDQIEQEFARLRFTERRPA